MVGRRPNNPGLPVSGAAIRARRQALNMPGKVAALRVKVSLSTLFRWERDEIQPTEYQLARLAKALRCRAETLTGGRDGA